MRRRVGNGDQAAGVKHGADDIGGSCTGIEPGEIIHPAVGRNTEVDSSRN